VFGAPYVPPVTDGSGSDRTQLREAARLLTEAGWEVKDGKRVNAKGETLDLELLIYEPITERILGPYVKNFAALGIPATIRRVDPAQYERRLKSFDFDLTTQRYTMRLTPGVELKGFFGSAAAKTDGSFNLAGIADPAVDALIDTLITAGSRQELVTAARALDRVLRAGHYWVAEWYFPAHRMAFWNRYSYPAEKPLYDRGCPDTWWLDPVKDATLRKN
jgi:microcin C transport system substrate-binding protein